MIDIDKIINTAREKDASDIHLICKIKPILRNLFLHMTKNI